MSDRTTKPAAASALPEITLPRLGGGTLRLGAPLDGRDWQMIVVYRGLHCPICKSYLKGLEGLLADYHAKGVDVIAVSGDPEAKAEAFVAETGITVPVGYGLSLEAMAALGLYISEPRSPQETDRPFAEPGIFVVNATGELQIVDLSNAPFARPDLEKLLSGIGFVRDNDYPIRGTMAA